MVQYLHQCKYKMINGMKSASVSRQIEQSCDMHCRNGLDMGARTLPVR
jgi:hypothetical protein